MKKNNNKAAQPRTPKPGRQDIDRHKQKNTPPFLPWGCVGFYCAGPALPWMSYFFT